MTKIKAVNPQIYFVESEKAIQIAKERQEDVKRALPTQYKLTLAKELLEGAKSREEYEELTKEIKELELELKYDKGFFPMVPEEHQSKIAFNRVFEEEKLDEELAKQKQLLMQLIDGLEDSLGTVLNNIEALEKRKRIGKTVDAILDFNIHKDRIANDLYHLSYLTTSAEQIYATKANQAREKFFKELKKISLSPTVTPEVKKTSIKERLLGGWK